MSISTTDCAQSWEEMIKIVEMAWEKALTVEFVVNSCTDT